MFALLLSSAIKGYLEFPVVKCDSLKYRIQMGVNDHGAHFRTFGEGGGGTGINSLLLSNCPL